LEAELGKQKEIAVQVQATELLMRENHQLGDLIAMVAKQAAVIGRLQTQLELEGRFNSRYLNAREGDAMQTRDNEAAPNIHVLDQLRHQIESELGALSALNAQLSDSFSRMTTMQDKHLAGT
jgi:hypothetical protein